MGQPIRAKSGDSRRHDHAAFVIPVFGALLLLPPLIGLFEGAPRLFGIPVRIVYLFLVWVMLVLSAMVTSWRMPGSARKPADSPSEDGG